jgi:GrpB-like predicted nucleotidyltransferase (UPF0157 family)/RimJ/RimL family protein N-acetyltransferase
MENLETSRTLLIVPNFGDEIEVLLSINKSKSHLRPWLKWTNKEFTENVIRKMISSYQLKIFQKEELRYYIWGKKHREFLGSVTLRNLDWNLKVAEVGYWLDVDHVGKGYIQEVVSFLLDYAYKSFGFNKFIAITYKNNTASINSLKKLGFSLDKVVVNKDSIEVAIFKFKKGEENMNLGLKNNEVKLVPQDKEWLNEFKRVQDDIHAATNLDLERIEHIGSTAIIEIAAKPVIDILIGVDNLDQLQDSFFKSLKGIGFHRLKVVREGEVVLAKFKDETFKEKTHFIHIVKYKGEKWSDLVFFRDCLNSNSSLRKQYEEIKSSFVANQQTGINDYTDLKEGFVKKVCGMKKIK